MPSKNEDEFFAKKDAELIDAHKKTAVEEKRRAERATHMMKCPKCGADLVEEDYRSVLVDRCLECNGIWFDAGEVERMNGHDEPGFVDGVLKAVFSIGRGGRKD